MSEPDSAFMTLKIERSDLVAWLEDRPRLASSWTDWRNIGNQWYFKGAPAEISDAELAQTLAECDAVLRSFESNRAALRQLLFSGEFFLNSVAEAPFFDRLTYDQQQREFVAGTLAYSENLSEFITYLTIARGSARSLQADGSGMVVIHDYIGGNNGTVAALRLGPGDKSEFMAEADLTNAVECFQPIADEMLADAAAADAGHPPQTHNELDTLK